MSTGAPLLPIRLHRHGLWGTGASDAVSALRGLGAMQGQEFAYALWALAQRVGVDTRPNRADLLDSFNRGDILRTHVLRPTWHLVLPGDVRAMLRLTRPRLRRTMIQFDRRMAVDRAELDRSQAILAAEVAGGRHRTRIQLADALQAAGIPGGGQRLGHLLSHAEFDEVLISGAMAGKQQTYAAFDERVPPDARPFDAEAALAALAARYMVARAPATARDFAGWASLTITQARAGLEAAGGRPEDRDGMTMFVPSDGAPEVPPVPRRPRADLVQGYDELIMSYSESRSVILPDGAALPVLNQDHYLHAVLIDGVLAGHWRHRLMARDAAVQVEPIRDWSAAERRAVERAVQDYGRYLGCPTSLTESPAEGRPV
ncbi:winged helix DNA-binding domain-containing protein [Nakamurella sp.]|uniref:winged helix DNA-binding domain-containing protein n=1 Tax=Nakamurella sp. TaxID=1869182 RepID=UPI003784465A